MILAWPIYLSLAVFAPVLLGIFGPEFVAGQTALLILALTMLAASAVDAVDTVLLMIIRIGLGSSVATLVLYEAIAGALYLALLVRFRESLELRAFTEALRLLGGLAVRLKDVPRSVELLLGGVKTSLQATTWSGWRAHLPS